MTRRARKEREERKNSVFKEGEFHLSKGKVEAAYRIVRSYFKEYHVKTNVFRSEENEILIENVDKMMRWKEYLEKQYSGKPLNSKILED
jgi:hypothetical protein